MCFERNLGRFKPEFPDSEGVYGLIWEDFLQQIYGENSQRLFEGISWDFFKEFS